MLYLSVVLCSLLAVSGSESEITSPIQIIEDEGQFAFTDNSSVYLFMDDGSFFMDPNGMSGRSIEGTWTYLDSNKFEITGEWGWCNGLSVLNDKRVMVLYVNLISGETSVSQSLWRSSDSRLYDVYFVIEELTKQ